MAQENVPRREEDVVAALGSHFEILAQLLQQAALDDGLQFLSTSLRASSVQLSRSLEERREPGWESAHIKSITASNSSEDFGDACGASRQRSPVSPSASGTNRPSGQVGPLQTPTSSESPKLPKRMWSKTSEGASPKHTDWVEDQLVLRELRSRSGTKSLADFEEDNELVENASQVFRYLRGVVGNARYEVFWAAVVMVNTLTMILEEEWTGIQSGHRIGVYETYGSDEFMNKWWPNASSAFFAIDCLFSLMFTIELILTFTYDIWNARLGFGVHFRQPFWTNPWDWLDFAIVTSSNLSLLVGFGDGPLSNARFLRIFRLVRLLRLVRLVRKINSLDPLHLMTTAIQGCLGALVFSTLLLFLIQSLFAMMMSQVVRYGWLSEGSSPLSDTAEKQLFRYFGTYTRSMVTMFELMLANWPRVCRFLMEDVHEIFGYLVVGYKLSVGFAVVGVINGVFIQETFSVAQNDEFIMVRSRLRQMEHHRQTVSRLFSMGDNDRSGTMTRDELSNLLKKRAIRTWLEAMDLRCSDPDMLFTLIAGDEAEVSIEEFIAGIGRLKGTARNIDVIAVIDILQQHQNTIMQDLQMLVQDIKRSSIEASRIEVRNDPLSI